MQTHAPRPFLARLWPALRARPRLMASTALGTLVFLAVRFSALSGTADTLIAWNAGAITHLLLTWHMARATDLEAIQRRAVTQGEGRFAILAVVVLAATAVLLAVGTQLAQVKELHGPARIAHVLLAIVTVVSSWLFLQTVFTLHYAHDFYLARHRRAADPLTFPGTADPLYADFFHFACVIGTSGQTADISFNGAALRPVGTVHCIVAFFFNASLLALAINVAASMLL